MSLVTIVRNGNEHLNEFVTINIYNIYYLEKINDITSEREANGGVYALAE